MSGPGSKDEETMQAIEPRAGDELERVMARYARVRLDPSPAQARRARAVVMEAAWRLRLDADPAPARRRGLFAGWSSRRVGAALSAAVLAGLLVGSSAFAASRAGGPLYGPRLVLEDLTLPADPVSRLEARIAQAQTRLAEASDAEIRRDDNALGAALTAYEQALGSIESTTGSDAGRALEAVRFHQSVLTRLLDDAPSAAMGGLTQALDRSDQAITRLTAADAGGSTNGTGGNGTGGNGGPGGNGTGGNGTGGNGGPGGSVAPTVAPTPAPASTPMPTPVATPKPDHTPRPDHTPKPNTTAPPPMPSASTMP